MKQNITVWDCACSYVTMQVTAVKTLGNCEEELPKNLSADCRSTVGRQSDEC